METCPIEYHSYTSIIPKFDIEQAKRLFWKGRTIEELTAAAERLGDAKLKEDIVKFSQELEQDLQDMEE
jgi:hypothetical protein